MDDAAARRIPRALAERARDFLAGRSEPVQPRGAATVALVRDRATGGHPETRLEVYLLRRHQGMAFAAGMYAFPGGGVDKRDADQTPAWAGPGAAEWARLLSCSEAEARALVCAAIRETFEESGVLLAGRGPSDLVENTTGEDWERDREALIAQRLSFAGFLERRRLVARTDLLHAWAHWITPEFEPRRYDTRFFVARLPKGQRARNVSGEADRVVWLTPSDAVRGVEAGSMMMLPPTYVTVAELGAFATAEDVMLGAADRTIVTVLPGVEIVDGEVRLTEHGTPP